MKSRRKAKPRLVSTKTIIQGASLEPVTLVPAAPLDQAEQPGVAAGLSEECGKSDSGELENQLPERSTSASDEPYTRMPFLPVLIVSFLCACWIETFFWRQAGYPLARALLFFGSFFVTGGLLLGIKAPGARSYAVSGDLGNRHAHLADSASLYTMRSRAHLKTPEEIDDWNKECLYKLLAATELEIKNHAVPICMFLSAVLLFPLLARFHYAELWAAAILILSFLEQCYDRLSPARKASLTKYIPHPWLQSSITSEISDGIAQIRPFILIGLFSFAPFALVWLFAHWLMKLTRRKEEQTFNNRSDGSFSFVQNRRESEEEEECNFIHSPAFSATCLALFASGIPAACTYAIYQHLGVDAAFGYPSADPRFANIILGVDFYFGSLGCCISVLFFKNWFTFPLNFLGEEEEIQVTEKGLRRNIRSFFTQVLTLNMPGSGPQSLRWDQIKTLRTDRSKAPLYPLPQTAFPANSPVYGFLNRLALLVDGLNKNEHSEQYIYFSTADPALAANVPTGALQAALNKGGLGSTIRIHISDLNTEQRAMLYYCVKKWGPHVEIDERVAERMTGSTVLQEPRYTQLWFDLLSDKMTPKRSGTMPAGSQLDDGSLSVVEHLSSGGQANIYLARDKDGSEVILKEFILSTSDTPGALIESAASFETEATLLSQLDHDRVVKMRRFFACDRRLYLVLERVPGDSLRKFVRERQKPLSEQEAIDIALQVCEVLEYLHGQSPAIVHRDISPDNLIYGSDHGVTVIDFSLAAALKSRHTTNTMGKHSYVPPEQLRDEPCPASDIYALGATIYFLLTNEDPLPITVSDPGLKRPDVSPQLREIVRRATAFNLDERYTDVQWLRLDLEGVLASQE
jgi:tRNA A-37 threonylcarbamoyl transferase component Bud32